ncbi:hypothetical protein DSM25558_4974 [Agrobacterium sp. DSM 25558]|uniref:DUF1799 domain-containing protein n=1 Tax=Agrobacterium sp. DSM 25558 TaxID=1907665 RepID=UPI00097260B2|nr:DUF1799 domain-containing protein [Agrobacterium sp. DSM 25558]SCX30503.1 hypothetical protein DSM25558_4974 [Agrobacterium sp. DSM 25558]
MGRPDPASVASLDEDVAAQFEWMGMEIDPSDITSEEDEAFKVFATNWESVLAFLACETQWRVIAGAKKLIWLGLDYVAVDIVLRQYEFPNAVFADLQVMELEARSVLRGAPE